MRRRSGGVALAAVAAALALAAPAQAAKDPLNAFRVKPTAENKQQLAAAGSTSPRAIVGSTSRSTRRASRRARCAPTASTANRVTRLRGRPRRPADYTGSDAAWDVWTRYDAVSADSKEQYEEQYDRVAAEADRQEGQHRHDASRAPDLGREGHEERRHRARQHEAGRALQRAAARPRVAGGRDLPAHARLLRRQLRQTGTAVTSRPRDPRPHRRGGHPARRHARAVVLLHLQPGRLRVHVHRGQPAVAQEHGRQRRRRRSRRGRGRRRPEPQLLHQLGPRQRGLLGRPDSETYRGTGPASEPETKAMHGALEPGRLRLPEERPHGGRAAALSARLPAVHVDARQRDLRGAGR